MFTLITFATYWGTRHGGINSFNADFLSAVGIAYHSEVRIFCIVSEASQDDIDRAKNSYVTLLKLPYAPVDKIFSEEQSKVAIEMLRNLSINIDPKLTVWLGHDRITGSAAINAAKTMGGRSALIHHMSYDCYESFAENSQKAYEKWQDQRTLFNQADIVLAIGPLLRNAAQDLLSNGSKVHMLVPGLAEISVRSAPNTFSVYLSGRLSESSAKIKQGHLGIAAFSHAYKVACDSGMPEVLCKQPKLLLRGVDFAAEEALSAIGVNPESELKVFAEKYADRVVNLQALPFTENREELFDNLARSSIAMMPSWHEGFGLVAWEAIAAGVPLIISKHSGVYQLLEEEFPGRGTGCVYAMDVNGSATYPFFNKQDLNALANLLKEVAKSEAKSRKMAGELRGLLLDKYTWRNCADEALDVFGWNIQTNNIVDVDVIQIPRVVMVSDSDNLPVHIPSGQLKVNGLQSDSQLLRAEEAFIPFDNARKPELDKLDFWMDNAEYGLSVRLITGAGGLGKTRLAIELCQQRQKIGWYTGFLDSDLTANWAKDGWKNLKALNQPLLIVIDYVETRQQELIVLIKEILKSVSNNVVRILLLARDGGEWWDNLPSKDSTCESLLAGYATSGPHQLPALHSEIQSRQSAYKQALQIFATKLKRPVPEGMPELEGSHFDRPLYLQMAALLALYGERPTSAQGLTRALLGHEQRYWKGLLNQYELSEPEFFAEQLLSLTTLSGGFSTDKDALKYWQVINENLLSSIQFRQLFYALIPLYPGKQGLQGVKPDLLGEALVAKALLRPSADKLLDTVLGKSADFNTRINVLTVIARLLDRYQELHETIIEAITRNFLHCVKEFIAVATGTQSNLPMLAEQAFNRLRDNNKSQLAGVLESFINEESLQLAGFYLVIHQYLVNKFRDKYQKKQLDIEVIFTYSQKLVNCSISFSRAGLYNQAINYAKQALDIRQPLAVKNSDRISSGLANSLSNYAARLADVGKDEEAISYAKQALEMRQRLAEKDSDRFNPDLASSLSNYASHLSEVGNYEEAIGYAKRALEMNQRFAEKNSDRFEPSLARSLSNYASHLSEVGNYEEAIGYEKQALEMRQRLAEKNSDRFDPNLARSLSNYASHLSDVGNYEEAIGYAKRALEMNQRFAEKNSDRFDSDLANSLSNYASHLSDVGNYEEAIGYAKRALEIRQRLVVKNQLRYSEGKVISALSIAFFEWLNGVSNVDVDKLSIEMGGVLEHRRMEIEFYIKFIDFCLDKQQESKLMLVESAMELHRKLLFTGKVRVEDYWLCIAAWVAIYLPEKYIDFDWSEYKSQRKGNIPAWMRVVADRLSFDWPA